MEDEARQSQKERFVHGVHRSQLRGIKPISIGEIERLTDSRRQETVISLPHGVHRGPRCW